MLVLLMLLPQLHRLMQLGLLMHLLLMHSKPASLVLMPVPPACKGTRAGKEPIGNQSRKGNQKKASGSDGIEPGALGMGWTMVRVKPAPSERS